MLWSSTSRFTLNFGGCSIWIIWRLHSAQRLQLHTKSLMVPQSRGSIYAKDRIVAGAISIIGSSFQGAVSCQKSTASFGKCFFSRLPVENSSSQTDLKVLRSSHKEKIGTSKVPASAVIVKATLGPLAKPASFDVVHQEWRRTYGNVVGAVHEATKLGLQLSSKRYFESPRSLCRTSLQLGNSESFSMLHMFSRSVPDQFHVFHTWNPPFPIAISEEEKIQQGNPHDTQAGVQANEVLRAKKDRKHMITGQNPLHDSLVIVI